jgi:hypothetical protein
MNGLAVTDLSGQTAAKQATAKSRRDSVRTAAAIGKKALRIRPNSRRRGNRGLLTPTLL